MTLHEEVELKLIEEGLEFDHKNKRWSASDPWIKDTALLPHKRYIAL